MTYVYVQPPSIVYGLVTVQLRQFIYAWNSSLPNSLYSEKKHPLTFTFISP